MGAGVNLCRVQRGGDLCPVRGGRGLGVLLRGSREEISGCLACFDLSVPDGLVCWRQREVNGRSLIFNISALFIPTVNIASILNY